MQKIALSVLLLMALFTLSCDNDDSVSATEIESFNILITGLPDEIIAPYGSTRDIGFVVSVKDEDGLPASSVEVSISADNDYGNVSPGNAATDENGLLQVIHTVTISSAHRTIRLIAWAGNDSVAHSYTLIGENPPGVVRLIPEFTALAVPRGFSAGIELNAIVADSSGRAMEGVNVRFQLAKYNDETPVFGSIISNGLTDQVGRAKATFSSDLGSGTVFAQVLIGEEDVPDLKVQTPLTIRVIEDEIHLFTVNATPEDHKNVYQDAMITTEILVNLQDSEHIGIPNLQVKMNADIGVLSRPTLTDHNGNIRVYHRLIPSVHVPDFNGDFTATISAEIPDMDWIETTSVLISPVSQEQSKLTLATDKKFIWADGIGLSFANLTAMLTVGNKGIPNAEIEFTTSFQRSVVQSPSVTDRFGIARTVFDDLGHRSANGRGEPDSVLITAIYPPYGLQATTKIMIKGYNPVHRIALNVGAGTLVAGSGIRTPVRAHVYLYDGSFAPIGTEVFFSSVFGQFDKNSVRIEGDEGVALTSYIAGNQVDTDTLFAYVDDNINGRVFSNKELIDLIPGSSDKILHEKDVSGFKSEMGLPIRD